MNIVDKNINEAPAASGLRGLIGRLREHPLARVGPGLITGVADDDPSGIATYSQAGAQFGLNMLWTMPLCFPLMAALQSMCARIGRVTGKGLAANIKAFFPPVVLKFVVVLLLVANTLNIAADIAAMGEVAELVTGMNRHLATLFFSLGTLVLQVLVPYHRYVNFLKWLTLSLLAYAAVLFTVQVPWSEVALRTVWPKLALNSDTATMAVAIFGTTISPYLFFWQASEEVEEMKGDPPLIEDPARSGTELRRLRWDSWSGMFYSNVTSYFIILATAATLNVAGVTNIETAAQAASALQPLAEAMGWQEGLELKASDARGFYGVIAVSILAALVIQYLPINPMKALFWSAVINGVVAVPLMVVVILLASSRSVMGPFTSGRPIVILGWTATAVMAGASIMMLPPG